MSDELVVVSQPPPEEQPEPRRITPADVKLRDRLTVVEQFYHQVAGQQPTLCQCRFARYLDVSEQPYDRKLVLGDQWVKLDTGWIGEVGMLKIVNEEGKFLQTIPDDDERERVAGLIIEVGSELLDIPLWEVPPTESCRLQPSAAVTKTLRIRCRGGKARCRIIAVGV